MEEALAATTDTVPEAWAFPGNLCAEVRETHTGVVVLIGDKAYKATKPVATDFLDFSTPDLRERVCVREYTLNSRLSPDSYLGIAHLSDPQSGPPEPVIVMRRFSRIPTAWPRWSSAISRFMITSWQSPKHWRGITVTLPVARRSTTAAPFRRLPRDGDKILAS